MAQLQLGPEEGEEERDHGCLCNSSYRYFKDSAQIKNLRVSITKLTLQPKVVTGPLDPTKDHLKWQRLKVRTVVGRGLWTLLSCGSLYLPVSPESSSAKWGGGRENGDTVAWTPFNLEFCFSLLFNWPASDEQELTNSLKSPREDEQRYAAYVRSGKGVGGQRPGVVTEMEREKSS